MLVNKRPFVGILGKQEVEFLDIYLLDHKGSRVSTIASFSDINLVICCSSICALAFGNEDFFGGEIVLKGGGGGGGDDLIIELKPDGATNTDCFLFGNCGTYFDGLSAILH